MAHCGASIKPTMPPKSKSSNQPKLNLDFAKIKKNLGSLSLACASDAEGSKSKRPALDLETIKKNLQSLDINTDSAHHQSSAAPPPKPALSLDIILQNLDMLGDCQSEASSPSSGTTGYSPGSQAPFAAQAQDEDSDQNDQPDNVSPICWCLKWFFDT